MAEHRKSENVEDILHSVEEAGHGHAEVTVEDMLAEIGTDAFPAIMLVPALIMVSPASGIPGLSTACAMIVALAAAQMIAGRKALWLPGFLLRRRLERGTLQKAVDWLERPARFVDRLLGRRLVVLTHRPLSLIAATACLVLSLIVPFLEFVPFSASIAGTAIAIFALGLVAGDGLLVLIAMTIAAGAVMFGLSVLG